MFWLSNVLRARCDEDGRRITRPTSSVIHAYLSVCVGFAHKSHFTSFPGWSFPKLTKTYSFVEILKLYGYWSWTTANPKEMCLRSAQGTFGMAACMDCPAVRRQTEALSSAPCPNISSSPLLSVNIYPSFYRFLYLSFLMNHTSVRSHSVVERVPGLCCIIKMDLLNSS